MTHNARNFDTKKGYFRDRRARNDAARPRNVATVDDRSIDARGAARLDARRYARDDDGDFGR